MRATSSGAPAGGPAQALLERGLQMYGDGDLLGAITEWEAALMMDPNLAQAREYVEYVRANFDELSHQFDAVRDAERAAEAQGVPVSDSPEDPDAYDSLDVEVSVTGGDDLEDGLAALDAGLDEVISGPLPSGALEDVVLADEPDPGQAVEIEAMAPDEDLPGIAPELEHGELEHGELEHGELEDLPEHPLLDEDEATIDVRMHRLLQRAPDARARDSKSPPQANARPGILTIQPRSAFNMPELDLDLQPPDDTVRARHDDLENSEDEATRAYEPPRQSGIVVTPHRQVPPTPRGGAPQLGGHEPPMLDLDDLADDDDLHQTSERGPFRASESRQPTSPPASTAPRREDSSVIVDERLLRGAGLMGMPTPGQAPLDIDRTVEFKPRRGSEPRDAKAVALTRRVTELLAEAQVAADRGNFLQAVSTVEEAGKLDEDGSIAPVLLHRHRDLLYRIYEGHIGDLTAVPLVAVPLHEISAQALDHRTGFLLSRIDGMLTFEDILDVAGMPRMEAYQILSSLLRKGVIEVR